MSPSQRATRGADEPRPPERRAGSALSSSAESYSAASAPSIFCCSRLSEISSSSADASPSNKRQRNSLAWSSVRSPASAMTSTQNEIDGCQRRSCQLQVHLLGELTINTPRAERNAFCNGLTFGGSESAESAPQERKHVNKLRLVQMADPFVEQASQLSIVNQQQRAVAEEAVHPSGLVCGRNSSR